MDVLTISEAVEAFIAETEEKRRQEMERFREFTTTLQHGHGQLEQDLRTSQSRLKETELKLEESEGAITLFRHQMEKVSEEKCTAESKVKDLEKELEEMMNRVAELEKSLTESEQGRVETQLKWEQVKQGWEAMKFHFDATQSM